MKTKKTQYAMTLVEVIVALAIFGIIMIAFLSLFVSGAVGIYGAGDKGVAYNLAQDDLDSKIASGINVVSAPITVNFGANAFIIEGGFLDTSKFFRNKTSELEAFIPILPKIQIQPNIHFEGTAIPFTITVVGINTHFTASTKVEVLSRTGTLIESINTITYVDPTNISFAITTNLINAQSDYSIRIYTPRAGLPDEVVRAKYSVYMPNLVAATEDSVYVSENGINWYKTYTVTSAFGDPLAAAYGDQKYLISGSDGKYLLSSEYQGMTMVNTGNTVPINDVTWSNFYKKFYSVSNTGVIRSSMNGNVWVEVLPSTGTALYGISVSEAGKIIAVGNNNRIYYSDNGTTWANVTVTGVTRLNDVFAYNDGTAPFYVAVGNTGSLYLSADGITWTKKVLSTTSNLNSVEYYLGKLLVVGNSGLIMTSLDKGINWTEMTSGTTNYIGSTFLTGTDAVFVIGGTRMIKSTNLTSWTNVNTLSGETYRAITSK